MLLGDDMIDLKAKRVGILWKSAVFADTLSSLSHTPIKVNWYCHGLVLRGGRASELVVRGIEGSRADRRRE